MVETTSQQCVCTLYRGTVPLGLVGTVLLTVPPDAEVSATSILQCDCVCGWGVKEGIGVKRGCRGSLVRRGSAVRDTCARRQCRERSQPEGAVHTPRRGLGTPSLLTPGRWTSWLWDRRPCVSYGQAPWPGTLTWQPQLDDADGACRVIVAQCRHRGRLSQAG